MSDVGSYLLNYMDGWGRGAQDKPPRFSDPIYQKGHQDGVRDRYHAIRMECERIGVPMSIEDARSLIAESISTSTATATATTTDNSLVSTGDESKSIKLEPLDPLQSNFARIRERYLNSTHIPSGAKIDHEFNEDGTSRIRSGSYRSDVVKYETRKDDDPIRDVSPTKRIDVSSTPNQLDRGVDTQSNGHDGLFNDFDLG